MKKWTMMAVAFLLVVGGVYFGSPYYAVYSLRNAAIEADTDKLEASVDFPSVRESMKSQLSASLMTHMQNDPNMRNNPFAGLGALMAPAIVDRAVNTFVTSDGIAALVRGQKPNQYAEVKENPDIDSSSEYLSADRFRVRLRNTKINEDGPSLLFERRGFASWKLIKVELPSNLLEPQSGGTAAGVRNDGPAVPQKPEVSSLASVSTSLAIEKASFTQGYLVGAWVQQPGSCSNPDDQMVITPDGTTDDKIARYTVQSPTQMEGGVDAPTTFAISAVTPNSFTSRYSDPTVPEEEEIWRWRRCV